MRRNVIIFPHWGPSFKILANFIHRYFKESGIPSVLLLSSRFKDFLKIYILRKFFFNNTLIFIGNFIDENFFLKYAFPAFFTSQNTMFYGVCEGPLPPAYKSFYDNFNNIITANKYCAKELLTIGIKPTAIIPHAVNVEEFDAFKVKDLNEHKNKVKLLTVISALVPRKGLNIYLKVLKALFYENPGLRYKAEFILKVPELIEVPAELQDVIKVVSGWIGREDLIKLYKSADIVVIPSLSEGFSIPIIEAFAAGKPVISLDAPPMNELNTTRSGWLVKMQGQSVIGHIRYFIPDIDDFMNKLIIAIEDEDGRREKMEYIKEYRWNFHYQNVYGKFLELMK